MIVDECVMAYAPNFTSMARDSTFRTLAMDTEVVDSGPFHSNVTNNDRITPSNATWLFFSHPQWHNPENDVKARFAINGTTTGFEYLSNGFNATPLEYGGPMIWWLAEFNGTDYITTETWNNSGGAANESRGLMVGCEVDPVNVCMLTGSSNFSETGAYTLLTGFSAALDPSGMAGTNRIEVLVAGYYLCLSVTNRCTTTEIRKNGSGVAINGSYAHGYMSEIDYCVDYFEVGDYIEQYVTGADTITFRQLGMVRMGGITDSMAYTYNSTETLSSDDFFGGGRYFRTDLEWIDTTGGHPRCEFEYDPGIGVCTTCGHFNATAGYHLMIGKFVGRGGTFLQNVGSAMENNSVDLGYIWSNNRHDVGNDSSMCAAVVECVLDDDLRMGWDPSGTFINNAMTPWTNVFVTDVRCRGVARMITRTLTSVQRV
jgi:hypothetical protein